MPERHSDAYRRFLASFNAPLTNATWLHGYDESALAELEGDERFAVEDLLIRALDERDDGRVAKALTQLGTTRAVPALRRALERRTGETRIWIAVALRVLDQADPSKVLIEELDRAQAAQVAVSALEAMKLCPWENVESAVRTALDHAHGDVRWAALGTLFALWGLGREAELPRGKLAVLRAVIRSPLAAVQRLVRAEVGALEAQLDAGKKAKDLGLTAQPKMTDKRLKTVLESIHQGRDTDAWREDIDLAGLDAVDPATRDWLGWVLLSQLHEDDPRIPRALGHLDETRTLDALRERATSSTDLAAVEAAGAVLRLAGDDAEARRLLVRAASGKNEAVQSRAAQLLKEIGASESG